MTEEAKTEETNEYQVSVEEMHAILKRVSLFHFERGDMSWALVNEGSGIVLQGGNKLKNATLFGTAQKITEAEIIEGQLTARRDHEAAQEAAKNG